MYSLVLITDKSGLLYGIYKDNRLIKSAKEEAKTLDGLTTLWYHLKQQYSIKKIYYARGPGSLSAIKLLHIFVHTLHITSDIAIFATDSFYFNHASPIHAFGNQFFIKNQEGIQLQSLQTPPNNANFLPDCLNTQDFNQETIPLYIVPAV